LHEIAKSAMSVTDHGREKVEPRRGKPERKRSEWVAIRLFLWTVTFEEELLGESWERIFDRKQE
jgi:hypothetical protein